jgi:hypothetical protein
MKAWFTYLGSGNPVAPSSYVYSVNKPTCINGRVVCSIYSNYVGTLSPGGFSENLLIYIATGRPTGIKKYVYFLPLPS